MKKIISIITAALIAVLSFISAFSAMALEDSTAFSRNGYYIKDYDVNIDVQENNSLLVTENITANFTKPKHGIIRYIPIKNNVKRADGTSSTVRAKIRNLSVNNKNSVSIENSDYVIKIGDEDVTLEGEQSYTISYTYVMGQDAANGYDELYYNIIGDGWDTNIQNVTFKITMPKEFDSQKLGFSSGKYGTAGTNQIHYTVNENTISGRLENGLKNNEALTVRLELEEGYFTFDYTVYYLSLASMVAIPLIVLLIVFILWLKYGRDKKIVEIVEFYPPENMNSLEVKLWHNGMVTSKDTVSLLIELANEGYIKIHELGKNERPKYLGEIVIEKVKHYDGTDFCKRIFYNGLFKKYDKVRLSDLNEKFYVHADSIVSKLMTKDRLALIFDMKSLKMRLVGWISSILSLVLSILIFTTFIGGKLKFLCLAAGILISAAAFVFSFFIRRRTENSHLMLQKIEGFKLFLETAEKEKLETLVEDNPQYFYDILPYAYALGVSDKWTKKFESITMRPPEWYDSPAYSHYAMIHFINHSMNSAVSSMTSAPQTSSSGGSGFSGGGGGFSGGGSGGGGGGSW